MFLLQRVLYCVCSIVCLHVYIHTHIIHSKWRRWQCEPKQTDKFVHNLPTSVSQYKQNTFLPSLFSRNLTLSGDDNLRNSREATFFYKINFYFKNKHAYFTTIERERMSREVIIPQAETKDDDAMRRKTTWEIYRLILVIVWLFLLIVVIVFISFYFISTPTA